MTQCGLEAKIFLASYFSSLTASGAPATQREVDQPPAYIYREENKTYEETFRGCGRYRPDP